MKMDRVLIVDDDKPIRRVIAGMLTPKGWSCSMAAGAGEARSLLRKSHFELVLCDVNLPGRSGINLVRELLRNHPDTAMMIMTGVDDPDVAEVAIDAGAYGYLLKPFVANEVLINVANAMRRRTLETERRTERCLPEHTVHERTAALENPIGAPFPEIEVDSLLGEVRVCGADLKLAKSEFDIFNFLVQNAHRYVSQQEILAGAFGRHNGDPSVVRGVVRHLRVKLCWATDRVAIIAKAGWGYRLVVATATRRSGFFLSSRSGSEASPRRGDRERSVDLEPHDQGSGTGTTCGIGRSDRPAESPSRPKTRAHGTHRTLCWKVPRASRSVRLMRFELFAAAACAMSCLVVCGCVRDTIPDPRDAADAYAAAAARRRVLIREHGGHA